MSAAGRARLWWRCRWGFARLAVALVLLWFLLADTSARLARLQLAALPEMDYAGEVRHLRTAGRYAEAVTVAEAGLASPTIDGAAREALGREREETERERSGWLRRAKDVGLGALSGQGSSIEGLIGAVGADMLVVGDVRDLVIQGGKYALDGEADELIVLLSAAGLATTLAPEIDWAPALVKMARKSGAMTARLGEELKMLLQAGKTEELRGVFAAVTRLAKASSPAQAVRLLRFADDPKDIETLARFVEREKGGAFALHVVGKEGADLIKVGDATLAADKSVVAAARKGGAGVAWLRTGNARWLVKAHPILGLVKGVYKGNVERLVMRALAATDGRAWWLIPLLAAWVFVEGAVIVARVGGTDRAERAHRQAPPASALASNRGAP